MADSVALPTDHSIMEALQTEAATKTPRAVRLNHVDGLRACAALWVLSFHTWWFGFAHPSQVPPWYERPFSAGHLGVPIFLVLSGFCLAVPYAGTANPGADIRKFAIRRVVRIVPPYWICTVACAALLVAMGRSSFGASGLTDLAWHLALVQNLSGDHFFTINGSLWSVALEFQLYFLFPCLLALSRVPSRVLWFGGMVSLGCWAILRAGGVYDDSAFGHVWWFSAPSFLVIFCMGIWAARVQHSWPVGRLSCLALALGLAAVLVDPWSGFYPQTSILLAASATVCILLAGPRGILAQGLGWRPLASLGLVSYTLYLIHNPFVSLGGKLLEPRLHGAVLVAGMIGCACIPVVVAPILFRILELPFHRLARRLASAEPARD